MEQKSNKEKYLIVRVTCEEKQLVERTAKQRGVHTSDFIRNAVRNEIAQLKKESAA
jgi:uncharacterized protein (DUF1778 family)